MRASAIVCASLVALALTADGASATTTPISTSKSNSFKIGTAPGTITVENCTKAHGVITTNADGTKTCTVPAGTSASINNSKSNSY